MSANKLSDYYAEVKKQGVRLSNQWKMKFTGFDGDSSGKLSSVAKALGDERVSIWAQGAVIPSITQEVAEIAYQGQIIHVPTIAKQSQDLSLTFNAQQDMKYRHAFEYWINVISNIDYAALGGAGVTQPLEGIAHAGGGFKDIPAVNCEITLMKPDMVTALETYVLVGVMPVEVAEAELSNAESGVIQYGVTFKYQYWYRKEESGGGAAFT